MKNKLLSIFVAFVRKTFSKDRLLAFISDLLDVLYENFGFIDDTHESGDFDV